jgi:hypothetical protein
VSLLTERDTFLFLNADDIYIRSAATTAAHEFSPVCAIIGGLLGQDILKSLGRRDPPMDNFFVFDGLAGSGSVLTMRMPNADKSSAVDSLQLI